MAISQQTPYNNYTGNGSTTVFAYTFKLFLASDLKVYLDGVLQTETTHYTVSGVGTESGGNVTFVAAPASSVAVQLVRSIPYNRLVDYQTSGDLLANTLDDDLDRVVAQVQQLEQAVVDSVSAPLPGSNYDAGGRRVVNLADPVGAQDAMTYASALASVTTAVASASAAQSAQSAAEIAQAAAEAAFDSFDDRYLGAKAADPTLDNDGNALVAGALYFNTTSNVMRAYTGSVWQDNNAVVDNSIALTKLARVGTAGQVLTSGGAGADPSYQDPTTTVFASSAENAAGTIENKAVDPRGIREAFNASGSAPVYACRAWVNFNGTGTVAIRASGNVSSITDNGTGDYTVNFTTAMPHSGYAVESASTTAASNSCMAISPHRSSSTYTAPTTSAFRVFSHGPVSGIPEDAIYVQLSVFA